ncbi:hypothetical protein NQ318_001128 [Aromia moschata]|uniref:Chitin-binding type-2 domain-containing protein n=1 Tax=Aromia moschata TaxID=1265417 RepID=A0AAV8ZEI7_9CUCU|nr:hypothetical protein NQ318_001128 [Aromia moschata]
MINMQAFKVYHHCLFGTRYDFLCANYTAFDQKTFICHFASEVDCAHSKNFWHRTDKDDDDDGYIFQERRSLPGSVDHHHKTLRDLHASPSSGAGASPRATGSVRPPLNPTGPGLGRPMVGRRRPFRRRRPQFDYYEDDYYDYYEERPRSNRGRKRPRPRPRPLYDDEYEDDYEDDRYERRGGTRRDENRRPYERRPSAKRRNKDRVKQDYLDETDDRLEDEDYKSGGRRKPNDRKNFDDESDEDRYPESRKPNRRRPLNDRNEEDEKRPRRGQRRPVNDDYEDDAFQADDSIGYERPKKNEERRPRPKEEPKPIIKPVSGTIYDRPRVAPRIKLPVPKNEANKYAYKPVTSTETVPAVQDSEDYYEYYEEEPPSKRKFNTRRPLQESRNTRSKTREGPSKEASDDVRPRARKPDLLHETSNPKPTKSRPRPVSEEYYDDYEEYEDEEQSVGTASRNKGDNKEKSTTSTTTTTTTERTVEKVKQPVVRLVKRPFLPSRGGNPYAARGLQPVGAKARSEEQVRKIQEESLVDEDSEEKLEQPEGLHNRESDAIKPLFKPSAVMIKVPVRSRPLTINSESFRSTSYTTEDAPVPRTTQKPRFPDRNPLDINEEEYDVTLNDALNPTLPNLPVRGSPAGFSPNDDYVPLGNFQRSRYVLEPLASQTGADYVYQNQPVAVETPRDRLAVSDNRDFNGQYASIRDSYRPRRVQQRTEAVYSRY